MEGVFWVAEESMPKEGAVIVGNPSINLQCPSLALPVIRQNSCKLLTTVASSYQAAQACSCGSTQSATTRLQSRCYFDQFSATGLARELRQFRSSVEHAREIWDAPSPPTSWS
jgi:hypothetical protein